MGVEVVRLAGQERYTTALEIAKYFDAGNGYTEIAIATGLDYPDALAGAVYAAKKNMPLILVNKDRVDSYVADSLNAYNLHKAYIFGGSGVVADKVVE